MAHGATGLKSTFASVNPYSNEVVREFPSLTDDDIDRAVDAAHRAFGAWRDEPVERRAAVIRNAAELMRERYEDLAHTITLEMGKLIRHSRAELDLTIRILEYYAERGPEQIADEPLQMDDDGSAVIRNEPMGVLLTIQPWNFPAYQRVAASGAWRAMFAVSLLPAAAFVLGMSPAPEPHPAARKDQPAVVPPRRLLVSWARPALVIALVLAVAQQFSGINAVVTYAPSIMENTGLNVSDSILYSVAMALVNVIATVTSFALVDRVGRRPLLLGSAAGMAVALGGLGLTFLLPEGAPKSWLSLACLLTFIAAYAVGMGPVSGPSSPRSSRRPCVPPAPASPRRRTGSPTSPWGSRSSPSPGRSARPRRSGYSRACACLRSLRQPLRSGDQGADVRGGRRPGPRPVERGAASPYGRVS